MPNRNDTSPAKDSTLLPSGMTSVGLAPLVIADDADHTLDVAGILSTVTPTLLQVYAEGGAFVVEAGVAPDQSNSLPYPASLVHKFPVVSGKVLHFKRRSGAATVTLWFKAFWAM